MESFNFIESAVLLNVSTENLHEVDLSEKHFSIHKDAFNFIQEYVDRTGETPTIPLLKSKFNDLDDGAIGVSLDYAIPALKNQYIIRESVETVQEDINKIRNNPNPVSTLNHMISNLDILVNQVSDNDEIALHDSGTLERLELYRQRGELRRRLGIIGIPTPLRTINRMGTGIEPGNVMAIYARPHVGKSWFCLRQAAIALESGRRVLMISPEMTRQEIDRRLDVIIGRMKGYIFSHKGLSKGEGIDEAKYREFLENHNSKRLLTCDHLADGNITHSGIRSLLRRHKPDMVIVDAFYLIENDSAKSNAMWESISSLIRGLKTTCVSMGICAVVTVQANRGASDLFKPPKPEEVAFSDGILQTCDFVLSMSCVKDDEYARNVQLQKVRDSESPARYVTLDWDVDSGLITERRQEVVYDEE